MAVRSYHARGFAAWPADVGRLLDSLASAEDRLWPHDRWPAMRFDGPLRTGARGGHGPIRYTIAEYEPGRWIRFAFTAPSGFHGEHWFRVIAAGPAGVELQHGLEMMVRGLARFSWPLVYRPLHDALIEDSLDRAAVALGTPATARDWSLWVCILRAVLRRRRRRPPARGRT